MTAAETRYKLTRYRGDTIADVFLLKDRSGNPRDLTGWTFTLTVDSRSDPPDATTVIYSISGTVLTPESLGTVEFVPTSGNANQSPGTYYYDIQAVMPDARKVTLVKSTYTYVQDITKS